MDEIKSKIINMLNETYENVDPDIIEQYDLIEDLNMDSITFISMIIEIETEFNISIPDDLLIFENFRNVDSIVNIVKEQVNLSINKENI